MFFINGDRGLTNSGGTLFLSKITHETQHNQAFSTTRGGKQVGGMGDGGCELEPSETRHPSSFAEEETSDKSPISSLYILYIAAVRKEKGGCGHSSKHNTFLVEKPKTRFLAVLLTMCY